MTAHDPGDIAKETYLCAPPESHHWIYQLSLEGVWVGRCSLCPTLTVDLEQHDASVRADERREVVLDHESGIVYRDIIESAYREHLRAQVEALPAEGNGLIWRRDVLDLLGGVQ